MLYKSDITIDEQLETSPQDTTLTWQSSVTLTLNYEGSNYPGMQIYMLTII